MIVLFWPHGHGSIPSVGFSADRKPHLEVYKYGSARLQPKRLQPRQTAQLGH